MSLTFDTDLIPYDSFLLLFFFVFCFFFFFFFFCFVFVLFFVVVVFSYCPVFNVSEEEGDYYLTQNCQIV